MSKFGPIRQVESIMSTNEMELTNKQTNRQKLKPLFRGLKKADDAESNFNCKLNKTINQTERLIPASPMKLIAVSTYKRHNRFENKKIFFYSQFHATYAYSKVCH